jgi:tetratricopeptide (TPR) repeat protein
MKKLFMATLAFTAVATINAQFKLPAASPKQKLMQEFGAGSVEIAYSRPSMKGRKIFGSLEKYGEVWRTGANEATTVRFTEPVTIANQKLDSGTYALFTIPSATEWVVIFNKAVNSWGAYDYKKEEDVVRINIKPNMFKPALELFTIDFRNIKKDALDMRLAWENTEIVLPITMDLKSVLKAKLDKAMEGEKKPYNRAAQYYNEIANDPKTALDMCDKGAEANPKDAYKIMYYKIKVLDQMGNKVEAKTAAEKALAMATEAKDTDYAEAIKELQTEMSKVVAPAKSTKK